MNLKKFIFLLIISCFSLTINAQSNEDRTQINLNNKLNNNRCLIYYYLYKVKNSKQDSLNEIINFNRNYEDYMFFDDWIDFGNYYIDNNDTNNAIISINKAIDNGLDSIYLFKNFNEKQLYVNYLYKILNENYNTHHKIYINSIDTILVKEYELMLNLDQLIRGQFSTYIKTSMEKDFLEIANNIDSINLIHLKQLIKNNKGISKNKLGHYSKFITLFMHTTDYNQSEYLTILNFLKNQVLLNNISLSDLLYFTKRHLRDNKNGGICSAYYFENNVKCNCDEIENYWLKNGFGSFKLYLKFNKLNYKVCE